MMIAATNCLPVDLFTPQITNGTTCFYQNTEGQIGVLTTTPAAFQAIGLKCQRQQMDSNCTYYGCTGSFPKSSVSCVSGTIFYMTVFANATARTGWEFYSGNMINPGACVSSPAASLFNNGDNLGWINPGGSISTAIYENGGGGWAEAFSVEAKSMACCTAYESRRN